VCFQGRSCYKSELRFYFNLFIFLRRVFFSAEKTKHFIVKDRERREVVDCILFKPSFFFLGMSSSEAGKLAGASKIPGLIGTYFFRHAPSCSNVGVRGADGGTCPLFPFRFDAKVAGEVAAKFKEIAASTEPQGADASPLVFLRKLIAENVVKNLVAAKGPYTGGDHHFYDGVDLAPWTRQLRKSHVAWDGKVIFASRMPRSVLTAQLLAAQWVREKGGEAAVVFPKIIILDFIEEEPYDMVDQEAFGHKIAYKKKNEGLYGYRIEQLLVYLQVFWAANPWKSQALLLEQTTAENILFYKDFVERNQSPRPPLAAVIPPSADAEDLAQYWSQVVRALRLLYREEFGAVPQRAVVTVSHGNWLLNHIARDAGARLANLDLVHEQFHWGARPGARQAPEPRQSEIIHGETISEREEPPRFLEKCKKKYAAMNELTDNQLEEFCETLQSYLDYDDEGPPETTAATGVKEHLPSSGDKEAKLDRFKKTFQTREYLGRTTWTFLHFLTMQEPPKEQSVVDSLVKITRFWFKNYPCEACRQSFNAPLAVPGSERNEGALMAWWLAETDECLDPKHGAEANWSLLKEKLVELHNKVSSQIREQKKTTTGASEESFGMHFSVADAEKVFKWGGGE
jgi:hypothetical protein